MSAPPMFHVPMVHFTFYIVVDADDEQIDFNVAS